MACEVLVGTQQNHRSCDLPTRERRWDGHDVCSYHRLQVRVLPFESDRLLSPAEINRRHWH